MSLLILIVSSFFWGIFDLLRKLVLEYLSISQVICVIFISQLIFFFFSLFFSNLLVSDPNYFLYLIIISVLSLLAIFCFLKAIKIGEISMSIPLLSYSPLLSLLFSNYFLGENLEAQQYFGVATIFFGSFTLYSKSLKVQDLLLSPVTLMKNKGAQLIICVTIIWSIIPVLDKKSLTYTDIYLHGFLQSLLIVFLLLIFIKTPITKKIIKLKKKKEIFLFLLLIIFSFLTTLLQFLALKINLVPILEVFKRAIGILLALYFGYFFFNEKINKQKIISIIVITLGLLFVI